MTSNVYKLFGDISFINTKPNYASRSQQYNQANIHTCAPKCMPHASKHRTFTPFKLIFFLGSFLRINIFRAAFECQLYELSVRFVS